MNLSLLSDITSIIFRVVSLVIILLFVFPLQYHQSKVKDKIAKLRKRLLRFGITVIVIDFLAILAIVARISIDGDISLIIRQLLSLINGGGFLLIAYFGYKIYHEQYLD